MRRVTRRLPFRAPLGAEFLDCPRWREQVVVEIRGEELLQ
jgi:hypothetical protein